MAIVLRLVAGVILLLAGAAYAEPWIPVSSIIREGPQTVISVSQDERGNTVIKAVDADSFEGSFTGPFAEMLTVTLHADGRSDFVLDMVFDGTAAGAVGTMHMRGVGHGGSGTASGTWEIIEGTGRSGLRHARGGGTWTVDLTTGVGQAVGYMKLRRDKDKREEMESLDSDRAPLD